MTCPRHLLMALAILAAVALAAATPSRSADRSARVLHVGHWPGLRHTYRSIQAAVNAARPGDRILIAPGDYHETPNSAYGVRVRTPDITIAGVNRNTVIVDGTERSAPAPCDSAPRFQNFGSPVHESQGVVLNGRNGIVIDHVSGVTVENLTVCNFLGTGSTNMYGNEVWLDGGAATGKTGLDGYHIKNVTTTSTYIPGSKGPQRPLDLAAYTGFLISNASGPGSVATSFASNMTDSGFHIAGCPDCNTRFDNDTAIHNVIGFSGTDAGGRLLVTHSLFEHNGAGINLASENNEDAPPPQDGSCPRGSTGPEPIAPHICTVIEHNTVTANNNVDVSPDAATVLLGTGIDIAGGKHDLVFENNVSSQGSWGILTTVYPDLHSGGFPNAHCQGGQALPASGCFFTASGNVIANNTLDHNGTFGNPTNGDLADATVASGETNCYRGNTDSTGHLSRTPNRLQAASGCAAPWGDTFFGVPGVQVLCAVRAFGTCTGQNENALNALTSLSHLLHVPFDAKFVRNTKAAYPIPGNYVAPRPAPQPSLHR